MARTEIVTNLQLADGTPAAGTITAVTSEAVTFDGNATVVPRIAVFEVREGVAYHQGTDNRMTLPATAVGTPAGVWIALSFKQTNDPRPVPLGHYIIPASDEPVLFSTLDPVTPAP